MSTKGHARFFRFQSQVMTPLERAKELRLKHLQGQHDQGTHGQGGSVSHVIPAHVRDFHKETSGRAQEIAKKHGLPDALEGVYLVGSQAKGTARPHSDVDFLVKTVPFHVYHAKKGGDRKSLLDKWEAMELEMDGLATKRGGHKYEVFVTDDVEGVTLSLDQYKEKDDVPNYHRVGNASLQRCGTCRHYADSGRCDLYEFKADAMYTCDSWRPNIDALKKARMGAEAETTKHLSHNQASHGFRFGSTPSLEQARKYRKAGVMEQYAHRSRQLSGKRSARDKNEEKRDRAEGNKSLDSAVRLGLVKDRAETVRIAKAAQRVQGGGWATAVGRAIVAKSIENIRNRVAQGGERTEIYRKLLEELEKTKEVSATPTAVYAHGPGGLFSPAGLSRKHGVVTADVTPNGSTGKRKKKRKEWVATTKPGGKSPGPSIKNVRVYEALLKKGMSKSQAAAISNAMANRGKKAKETAVTPLEYARSLKHVSHDQKTHGVRHGVGGLREFAKKRGYSIRDRGENASGGRYEIRGAGHGPMRAGGITSAKKLMRSASKFDRDSKRKLDQSRKRIEAETGRNAKSKAILKGLPDRSRKALMGFKRNGPTDVMDVPGITAGGRKTNPRITKPGADTMNQLFSMGLVKQIPLISASGGYAFTLTDLGRQVYDVGGASNKETTAVSDRLAYAQSLKHASHNQASHGFRFGRTPSLEQARRYRKAGVLQEYSKRSRERSGTKPAKERQGEKPKIIASDEKPKRADYNIEKWDNTTRKYKPEAVKGDVLGDYGIRKDGNYWEIDHVPTGASMQFYAKRRGDALKFVQYLHGSKVRIPIKNGQIDGDAWNQPNNHARKTLLWLRQNLTGYLGTGIINEIATAKEVKSTFTVFKDKTGRYRWVAISSTAYRDRDGEIVSTKALLDDVSRTDTTGDYGPLRWWHVPGLDLGDTDFSMVYGRSLIESGTFKNDRIAERVKEKAHLLKLSLGFRHPADEPDKSGVFHNIRRFERSLIPPEGNASNLFTSLVVT